MKQLQKIVTKLDSFQQKHRFTAFIYAVIKKYGEDGAGYQAALLTYYGFLSLFPLLLVLTTLASMVLGDHPHLEKTVIDGLTNYFPLLGSQLASHVHALDRSGLALLAGILFTIYGTRGVADVFRHGIQKIWGVPKNYKDGFPKSLIKSLGIVIIGGLGFILAAISASLAAAAGHGWEFRLLSLAVNLFILFWLFSFLLNVSLPRHVKIKEIRVGAVSAALGLVFLQLVGGYVLTRELKNLDALYSYYAVALGLLFWIYLQAQMIYYAAEIAVVSAKHLYPRSFSEPEPK